MTYPLFIIVLAELFGGSLWFSANGAADGLIQEWGISTVQVGFLTSAVQLGFISGTLVFALSGLADRYSASRIFAFCAVIGSICNVIFALAGSNFGVALGFRFLTGVMLAGIYPIGMKLVVGWAPDKKAMALGWLVGMLTLGTALPHFVRGMLIHSDWQLVIYSASALAMLAALAIYLLGDGPHGHSNQTMHWGGVLKVFRKPGFRSAAFGYFGHMWELYAFWTLVPFIILLIFADNEKFSTSQVSLLSFAIIGIGALGCIVGGYISRYLGSARVAFIALASSGAMCLLFPLLLSWSNTGLIVLLMFWGIMVVADSPQFSALASENCPPEFVGSALAIMNSIGFLLTVMAIELTTVLWTYMGYQVVWLLLPGPILGLWGMRRAVKKGGFGLESSEKPAKTL